MALAGRFADGVYANPYTIEDGRAQRSALREAAERAGRDPDEIKMFAGFMPTIAAFRRAALDRRNLLDEYRRTDFRVRVCRGPARSTRAAENREDQPAGRPGDAASASFHLRRSP